MSLLANAQPCCFVLTGDRARSLPFYVEVLGLAVISEDYHAVTLDLGGGVPMRLTTHPGHTPAAHTVVGWNVADIRAAIAGLAAKGVHFTVYDGFGQDADGVWTAPGGAAQVAWFPDPDGNMLSLTQFG
jgi:catechol 2,3-dioxygenase-like lactoylglutathione lyase family enzyme